MTKIQFLINIIGCAIVAFGILWTVLELGFIIIGMPRVHYLIIAFTIVIVGLLLGEWRKKQPPQPKL